MDLGFRGGRIVLIFGWVGQKVAILVWSSENVLILGMARVRSGDFMYRSGFVSNPVDKTLICGDFLFNPKKTHSPQYPCPGGARRRPQALITWARTLNSMNHRPRAIPHRHSTWVHAYDLHAYGIPVQMIPGLWNEIIGD